MISNVITLLLILNAFHISGSGSAREVFAKGNGELLIPIHKNEKWGFCNKEKDMIIPFRYDDVQIIGRNRAKVFINRNCGLLNLSDGKELTPLMYDNIISIPLTVHSQSERYYRIRLNWNDGLIDSSGNVIIPPNYDSISVNLHNNSLEEIISVKHKDKRGVYNVKSKMLSSIKYDGFSILNERFVLVWVGDKCGFVNSEEGEEITEIKYDFSLDVYLNHIDYSFLYEDKEMAKVKLNGKYGFIDDQGIELVPAIYDSARGFNHGLVAVYLNGKWGFVDKWNNIKIPFKYDYAAAFDETNEDICLARVGIKDKRGYIDKDGQEIIPIIYDDIDEFVEGICEAKLNDKRGVFDQFGREIVPIQYDYIRINSWGKFPIKVKKGGKWGFYNRHGKRITPINYDEAGHFDSRLTMVSREGKYGYINEDGVEIVPLMFEDAYPWSLHGIAVVQQGDKWGAFNQKGDQILDFLYDDLHMNYSSLLEVQQNDLIALFDRSGKQLTSFRYDSVNRYWPYLHVIINDKIGLVDSLGNEVLPVEYKHLSLYGRNIFKVEREGKQYYVGKGGEIYHEEN
jgi:hypothetical protein